MDFRLPRITVDDPHFGDAESVVESKFLVAFVVRAVNFDDDRGCAFKVLVMVYMETIGCEQNEV